MYDASLKHISLKISTKKRHTTNNTITTFESSFVTDDGTQTRITTGIPTALTRADNGARLRRAEAEYGCYFPKALDIGLWTFKMDGHIYLSPTRNEGRRIVTI